MAKIHSDQRASNVGWRIRKRSGLLIAGVAALHFPADASILKWIKREALPTITGQRPVVIKDYVSVKSGATQIKLGKNSLLVKVGGVTIQTNDLRLRLAQAGCVYATGGDVATCAPDVIDREARKIYAQVAQRAMDGTLATGPAPGAVSASGGSGGSTTTISGGLKFETGGMTIREMEPPTASVGFDFSNPGIAPSGPPKPSAFFNNIAFARGKDAQGNATVEIVGRVDFAFMNGTRGGIICLFASEKGKYLKSAGGEFRDQYGVVALGSSTTVTQSPELVPINLSMPWSALNLPDDVDPYAAKFVQCHVTVGDDVGQTLEWAPF
jgi:hypothetical protein